MKSTVLLVEDHWDLAQTIVQSLESEEFVIDYAANGLQGLHLATTQHFDVIILDVMLPGINGYEFCSRLRDDFGSDVPVLMLTARDELDDKLTGFSSGADDYLVKPFQMDELIARITSLIKRKQGAVGAPKWTIDDLVVDINAMEVRRQETLIKLSPINFNILKILMRESPNVVSRSQLEQELWGDEPPDSDALRSHVYTLRKAIDKPFQKTLIKTIKGVGLKITDQ